jgi:hypothetical protein
VLICLLLIVNFQSWLDPFIIITALPGALAGVVWGLYLTLTTLSVPELISRRSPSFRKKPESSRSDRFPDFAFCRKALSHTGQGLYLSHFPGFRLPPARLPFSNVAHFSFFGSDRKFFCSELFNSINTR